MATDENSFLIVFCVFCHGVCRVSCFFNEKTGYCGCGAILQTGPGTLFQSASGG